MPEHPRAREWRQVDGIEVRLDTGELAKVQTRDGQGRAWVVERITRPGRPSPLTVVLFSGRKVDVLPAHIVWIGQR